ncbi:MAG: hypothetical protein ACTHLE_14260 [Agriterribacter sp.]
MNSDIDAVKARFRDEASVIYLRIMKTFEFNTQKLDRQKDENVFQRLTSRYADELKRELSQIAEQLIYQCGDGTKRNLLQQDFARQISYHISQWLLKVRSM